MMEAPDDETSANFKNSGYGAGFWGNYDQKHL
jgi:hypothetical protein